MGNCFSSFKRSFGDEAQQGRVEGMCPRPPVGALCPGWCTKHHGENFQEEP